MTTPNDEQLMQRIASRRDREAFQALFDRFGPKAFTLALYLSGNRAKAEEAVQDAMLSVWLKAGRFEPQRGTAKAWILRIVANKAIQAVRKEQSERNREMTLREDGAQTEAAAPENEMKKEALLGAVREKFAELPEAFRQVLALYFAAEMSQEEISKTLEIPQSTISVRIRQGLDDLRRRLKGAGYAAALPLVSANGFGDALLSGIDVPAGLGAKILRSLGNAAEHSVRAAAASRGGTGIWLAAAALAAVATAGGWWAAQRHHESVVRPYVPPEKTEAPAGQTRSLDAAVPAPANGHSADWSCSFQDGIPKNMVILNGQWDLRTLPYKKVKVLETNSENKASPSLLALPVCAGKTPFILEINYVMEEGAPSHSSLVLTDGEAIVQGWGQSRPLLTVAPRRSWAAMCVHYYCFDGKTIAAISGEAIDGQYVQSISRFLEPWQESDRLVLGSTHISMDSIRYRQVRMDEIPAAYRDYDGIAARFKSEGVLQKCVGENRTPLLERHKLLLRQSSDGKD